MLLTYLQKDLSICVYLYLYIYRCNAHMYVRIVQLVFLSASVAAEEHQGAAEKLRWKEAA